MSVSTSFGVEQQPVEASEAEELSTLRKLEFDLSSTSTRRSRIRRNTNGEHA